MIDDYLKKAQELAKRAGYRLVLADIHLFCAEVLMGGREKVAGDRGKRNSQIMLGLSTVLDLQKAKEYAWDVSEYSHLYQSSDPHFYDGIPEAAMLKRGVTQQERIDNGYWVAYQIAAALEETARALEAPGR